MSNVNNNGMAAFSEFFTSLVESVGLEPRNDIDKFIIKLSIETAMSSEDSSIFVREICNFGNLDDEFGIGELSYYLSLVKKFGVTSKDVRLVFEDMVKNKKEMKENV